MHDFCSPKEPAPVGEPAGPNPPGLRRGGSPGDCLSLCVRHIFSPVGCLALLLRAGIPWGEALPLVKKHPCEDIAGFRDQRALDQLRDLGDNAPLPRAASPRRAARGGSPGMRQPSPPQNPWDAYRGRCEAARGSATEARGGSPGRRQPSPPRNPWDGYRGLEANRVHPQEARDARLAVPGPAPEPLVPQRKKRSRDAHNVWNGASTTNRAGTPLCRDFNISQCQSVSSLGIQCPRDPSKVHQCQMCLGEHPAFAPGGNNCRLTPRPNSSSRFRDSTPLG